MTARAGPESDPPKRNIARLAFGHGHEVAGVVYGTIIAMATLTASYANIKDAWELAAIVWSTLFVLWIAHVYSHGLAESMARRRRLDRAELKSLARRELGILLSAAGPTLALLLSTFDAVTLSASVWVALGVGLGILGVEGLRYARLEKLGFGATLGITASNLVLGVLVVALTIGVTH